MRIFKFLVSVFLTLAITTTASLANGWVVEKVSQPARYTIDAQSWYEITSGMEIPNASWIHTGKRGRLILRRKAETIQFKQNTVASITERNERGGVKTSVKQKYGSLLMDVETRATKHAEVMTPYIAAVVKGTRFEVKVNRKGADLRVERGVVEATDIAGGQRVDVRAGQRTSVTARAPGKMSVKGPGPKAQVVAIAPAQPSMAPVEGGAVAEPASSAEAANNSSSSAGSGGSGGNSDQDDESDNWSPPEVNEAAATRPNGNAAAERGNSGGREKSNSSGGKSNAGGKGKNKSGNKGQNNSNGNGGNNGNGNGNNNAGGNGNGNSGGNGNNSAGSNGPGTPNSPPGNRGGSNFNNDDDDDDDNGGFNVNVNVGSGSIAVGIGSGGLNVGVGTGGSP